MKALHRMLCSICLATSLSAVAAPAMAATYRVEGLPPLGEGPFGTYAEARAIGPTGAVAGSSAIVEDSAVMWDEAGRIIELVVGGGSYSFSFDINKFNQVVFVNEVDNWHVWSNGTVSQFTLSDRSAFSLSSINDSGVIAGSMLPARTAYFRGFTSKNGATTVLGTLSETANHYTKAINNQEQVVGQVRFPSGVTHAVIWNNGVAMDLGVLPGDSSSEAAAINDVGQVVGTSSIKLSNGTTTTRAFFWNNGVMTELAGVPGAVSTFVTGINDAAQVVGYSLVGSGPSRRRIAFVASNGAVTELNSVLGGNSCEAVDINNAGQIAAVCNGAAYHVFRLTPDAAVGVDLGLQMVAPNSATQGNPLTFALTVANTGALAASDVRVRDVLPDGVDFVSVVPSQGACSGTQAIECNLGGLASGATATVQLTVTPLTIGTLTNTASVSANEADANSLNDTARASVQVSAPVAPTADLALGMTVSSSTSRVRVGSNLTYAITVTNTGPASATDVQVNDALPSRLSLVSATASTGSCPASTGSVTCTLGTLAQGSTATVRIVARPTVSGTVTNTATVTASSKDPRTSNNSASVSTRVR